MCLALSEEVRFFGCLLRKDVRQCQGGVDSPNVTCWGMVTEERVRQEREE